MRALHFRKRLWPLVLASALFILLSISANAQCSMCRTALNSPGGAAMAKNLNIGILVLLVPPVAIFCAIFFNAYKHRDGAGRDSHKAL